LAITRNNKVYYNRPNKTFIKNSPKKVCKPDLRDINEEESSDESSYISSRSSEHKLPNKAHDTAVKDT